VGFNDLQSALLNLYVKNSLKSDEEKISMTFSLHPLKEKDLFGRCELVNLFKKIRARCLRKDNEFLEDSAGGWYIGARNARKNAAQIIDALADMDKNLVVFEKNIKEIISLAELKGIRLIFLTQPSLWKNGLTNSEKDLLWFGYTQDKRKYYSIGALMKGLGQFNGRLKKICKEKNIECIELDTLLPKDTSVFYDDAHFNESGCRKIADILSEYLKENIKPRIKF